MKIVTLVVIIGAISGSIVGIIFMRYDSIVARIGTLAIFVSISWAICGALAVSFGKGEPQ